MYQSNFEYEIFDDYFPEPDLFDINDPNDPDESKLPPDKPQQDYKNSLIDRIRNEMNLTEEEFNAFANVLKEKMKNKKETYVRTVMTTHVNGDNRRCITCSRHFLSLNEEARIFEIAFYYFTYGKKYDRKFVYQLHNAICKSIGLVKMSREQSRSIRSYFHDFSSRGFLIIQEAHKYCLEHQEFLEKIALCKKNK